MSSCYLQVLSVDCDYHSASVAICTENNRFLFEAPEGIQRLAVEHKIRLGKIGGIFLTSGGTNSIGGLPGLLLTLNDSGVENIQVIGTKQSIKYMESTRYFMRKIGTLHGLYPPPDYSTIDYKFQDLTIRALVLHHIFHDRICYFAETCPIPGKFFLEKALALGIPKGPLFGKLKNGATITLEDGRVIKPEDVLGDPTPSKHFAIICRIYTSHEIESLISNTYFQKYYQNSTIPSAETLEIMVHFSDHKMVLSDKYQNWLKLFGPQTKHLFIGSKIALPYTSYIAGLIYNQKLNKLFPNVFVDILPSQQFKLTHSLEDLTVENHQKNQFKAQPLIKYHMLPVKATGFELFVPDKERIDEIQSIYETHKDKIIPFHESIKAIATPSPFVTPSFGKPNLLQIVFLGTGCAIPSKYRNVSSILLYREKYQNVILLDAGEGTWYQLMNIPPPILPKTQDLLNQEVLPNSIRWAKLLNIVWISHPHADHHLGLVTLILERKKALLEYHSMQGKNHQHASSKITPLIIISPFSVLRYLEDLCPLYEGLQDAYVGYLSNCFDPNAMCAPCLPLTTSSASLAGHTQELFIARTTSNDYDYKDNNPVKLPFPGETMNEDEPERKKSKKKSATISMDEEDISFMNENLRQLGIPKLENIPVIHCNQAYGLIIHLDLSKTQRIKLVYSGDTRPCMNLVDMGQFADILIHEATFEDEKSLEAIQKKHSTISEAQQVAMDMNAKHLIITHFSQRYHGVPDQLHPRNASDPSSQTKILTTENIASGVPGAFNPFPLTVAFDFMNISYEDLAWSHTITPLLAELFPANEVNEGNEEEEENENKA